ncbi:flagellar basal body-associated FliL family protein [Yoonia sp. 208BN28-4]|uniref:flagellar basal body-associated FliL family protein n=1 Tax=Yoonia sp. 208BN28-4 TaxID=3126505 RepID=UPI0030A77526
MKTLLLPIILLILGIGSGVGAGIFLKPADDVEEGSLTCTCDDAKILPPDADDAAAEAVPANAEGNEFAKLANQFVVPLVSNGEVSGLIAMSISLEVPEGGVEAAFALEPRLRDGFLQVMFDHANTGGFEGNFTSSSNMRILRRELLASAKRAAGDKISDVLILDIVRQDV